MLGVTRDVRLLATEDAGNCLKQNNLTGLVKDDDIEEGIGWRKQL